MLSASQITQACTRLRLDPSLDHDEVIEYLMSRLAPVKFEFGGRYLAVNGYEIPGRLKRGRVTSIAHQVNDQKP